MSNCAFCAQLARVSWLLVNVSNNKYSTDRTITGSSPAWDVLKGKNVYNLIPIRNTASKVKENVFCKRSNKNTRNTSSWAATRLEKRLQDPCKQTALSPGNQMAPVISLRQLSQEWQTTGLPALCISTFYFFFLALLAQWTKSRKPHLCLRSNHSLFLHGNSRKKKCIFNKMLLHTTKLTVRRLWIRQRGHAYRAEHC